MLFEIQSEKSLDQVCQDLEKATVNHKFGVMTVHDLKETMKRKGVEFDRECRIFEVCNPQQAKRVLEKNMQISTALPCRISVFTEGGGKVRLATLKPTALISQFNAPDLHSVAKEVEDILIGIMREAAG
ncbi:MAG: DUF302 domain-containing protein [Desulfobacteraceae bacterium]|nr:MAG: DUF302 domain-containing protein [Desulfobacteraceae bacterium]